MVWAGGGEGLPLVPPGSAGRASPTAASARPQPGCGGSAAGSKVTMEVSGLPVELWRLILSYLRLPDLGRCSLVCRAWCELILSLDNTRWRQLCLGCIECRHPNWPNQPDVEPQSWREAFKQHYVASKTWTKNAQDFESSNCFYLFRRKKDRHVLRVGQGCEFDTLRAALASADVYDRIVLLPGVYEEQSEIILKVPVEIVGQGKLGDVALLVSIDQHCPTTRLCNVVFMPAWFTPVVYKTTSGHVQFDNCNFENGQLQIHAPGTCQVKFCTFNQSSIHFHSVALGVLENCEFTGSENASVTIEGIPSSERNWACKHLTTLAKSHCVFLQASDPALCNASKRGGWGGPPVRSLRTCEIVVGGDQNNLLPASKTQLVLEKAGEREAEVNGKLYTAKEGDAMTLETDSSDGELSTSSENEDDDRSMYKLSYRAHGLSHMLAHVIHSRPQTSGLTALQRDLELKTLQQELQRDKEAQSLASSLQGCLIRKCLFRDGKGGVFVCSQGRAKLEGSVFRELTYAVRCIQNSKVLYRLIIMLKNDIHHCKASGIFLRLAAGGLIADNNIHSNCEAGVDIRKGANPLILCNKIHSGLRSGIVVLGNGKGIIRSNQIYGNKEAGIYILYNGNPIVSGNHIFQGLAAGIAVNENGRGQIIENVIRENQWGGVDIRRGGDPVLRSNLICCGYSDGVVVGERGKGLIEGNTIYAAGLYVKSSEALNIIANAIHANHDSGIAVLQSSQLTRIANNSISCNSLGGVLIESEARVELRGNGIYDNSSHGITSKGDGVVVENDIIGNRGCGLQLLQTADMKVTKNRIQSFWDYGIVMLDQTKGLVQENLIFQGRAKKTILQQVSNAEDCIVQNNKLLTFKSKSDVAWTLENPPARPYIEGSTRGTSSATNSQKVTTMSTRIAARMDGGCHNNGSIFCTIL
ncbi:F-box only protein 10 isoform X4 [Chelonia mydas]|uniref:F-box only protein 10 isoform X4 n=1 Tax=Chelonia mydas TaxID=8469 RepID=UPI001CA90376|nr:F-box only protein 10 isoform X4 [Chelonia mydas]